MGEEEIAMNPSLRAECASTRSCALSMEGGVTGNLGSPALARAEFRFSEDVATATSLRLQTVAMNAWECRSSRRSATFQLVRCRGLKERFMEKVLVLKSLVILFYELNMSLLT